MEKSEAIDLAIRLKRSTTNRDVISLCDALLAAVGPRQRAANGTFDRVTYQRDYMRLVRAKKKAQTQTEKRKGDR